MKYDSSKRQPTQPANESSCAWRKQRPDIADMLHRYGEAKRFLALFNPSLQTYAARFPERAYRGAAPTLACVADGYGEAVAEVWICIQLENVNLFAGVKGKMPVERQKELARLVMAEYPFLKTSELLLFFHRLKCGRYGRFYGSVDALFIASALLSFLDERQKERRQYAASRAEAQQQATAPSTGGMSYREYLLFKQQKQTTSQTQTQTDHAKE